MAVSTASPGPYAPASAILDIIGRYRSKGMQTPFTAEVLGRAGVSDSLIPRTTQALRMLDLINEEGVPTETLDGLRRSSEPEFRDALAAWIRSVYADVLTFVDPTDSESEIRDAFRAYNPVGQQARMVSLFVGLCSAAGLRTTEQTKETRPRPQARKSALPLSMAAIKRSEIQKLRGSTQHGGTPPALAGLLSSLPVVGGSWTKSERDKFVQTFGAVLDFCYAIKADEVDDE